ncbi:hypothetical protein HanRHA438_Chr09g0403151 [Helianthus annuus]|uniref:Uncharacterized protein n=1 Tax=Helianthus annuus TaxID=4232 RepID=A0A251TW75_HELAN|nr:hypothetical protein HanXRQr2_Chr09g0391401 [Helianthus annuus]KAJ0534665.1 hypothetical protein HanIR_Chr09g0422251 [Helianthus annuus]KAJ0542661.1 hypothetical protein HanHA89_Chr09g0342181 [Helianthus annuus]KAJ0888546.1 hypothetical protein HanRHA438_Chr09g0403151 [Helianthus annuus]
MNLDFIIIFHTNQSLIVSKLTRCLMTIKPTLSSPFVSQSYLDTLTPLSESELLRIRNLHPCYSLSLA